MTGILLIAGTMAMIGNVTHPAGTASDRVLTMEETILSKEVKPSDKRLAAKLKELEARGITFREAEAAPKAKLEGQSLYYTDAAGEDHPVAISENSQITYGQSVSRNEFGINGGTFWSPDKSRLAFYRKDESLVTDFPLLDITTRTGTLRSIKYPMNGMDSERITLGIYELSSGKTVWADVSDFGDDRYLTNISWTPDSRHVLIQVLDRSQSHCRLNMYSAETGAFEKTILSEDNDKYVEPLDPLHFIGNLFIYRTANRDGYRNLYLCDLDETVRRLTPCDADVEFNSIHGEYVYYTSAEVSPVENHLFRIRVRASKKASASASAAKVGVPERLTAEEGWHTCSISSDGEWLADSWSSYNVPLRDRISRLDGKGIAYDYAAPDPLAGFTTGEMEFGTVPSADGKYENYYRLIKPVGFDPSRKYPLIVYVYGGPHSQLVRDQWLGQIRLWEMYMAERGYVVYVQDNRGTSNRGLDFEQAIHDHCGQNEMADQMVGIRALMAQPWVDENRVGVHGWSYGGFMTISLATTYPDVFKVAVAGGPVIDWKWYEIMYGERYMDTEATNPEGFAQTSLLGKVNSLKAKLLICQGAIDNTVVWEHSLSFVQKCIENNVQLDYFPYPRSEHNVVGPWRVHLMDKVSQYFFDNL